MTASKYRKRPVVIEAYQWLKNGDHPEDRVGEDLHDPFTGDTYQRLEGAVVRFYRHPRIDGQKVCEKCGQVMHEHGWLDTLEGGDDGAQVVCPGDWVITTEAVFLARLADWLDSAALDAEAIGPNPYAERFAATALGEPDPYPRLAPPARPDREAAVTHVEGVRQ